MLRRFKIVNEGLAVSAFLASPLFVLLFSGGIGASSPSEPAPLALQDADKKLPQFVGAKNCKLCHVAPSTGNQFKVWQSGPHSKAYELLASDAAKETAKKKGIADPQNAPECLKCHVTGYGLPAERFGPKYAKEEGVSCESCHGAGEFYSLKEVFEKGKDAAIAAGLVVPDEKLCKTCHNPESPQYKEFNFEEAKKKIEHPKPKK